MFHYEIGQEPAQYNTLVAPNGWGNGEISDNDAKVASLIGGGLNQETETRSKVDHELRVALEARGLRVITRQRTSVLAPNEVTIASNIDERGLLVELPNIAPEVRVIPSEDYDPFMRHPRVPILAYVEGQGGGRGKYALDNLEQVQRIERLFTAVHGLEHVKDIMKFKPIIETPSGRYTSYRTVTTAMGDVIAGGLLYSGEPRHDTPKPDVPVDPYYYSTWAFDYLDMPESPYFIKTKQITSNVSSGGGCIPLNPTGHSRVIDAVEAGILVAHGIENQQIPDNILTASQKIGKYLGPHTGLVFGLDFIQARNGAVYFLEPNLGPGVQTINEVENGGAHDVEVGYRILMQKTLTSVFPDLA